MSVSSVTGMQMMEYGVRLASWDLSTLAAEETARCPSISPRVGILVALSDVQIAKKRILLTAPNLSYYYCQYHCSLFFLPSHSFPHPPLLISFVVH